jgi:predicted ATPase/DNA-binding Lrp family transcriptional regulator/DNA-binding CsgD family transcriptional regulator
MAVNMAVSQAAGTGRLPAETNEFVGRAAELRQIDELLRSARLVTLTGPGGVGKTRVALRAAKAAASRYDRVCLVEFSAVRDPELVPHTIARRLGLADQAGASQRDALLAHLCDRSLLLVLDTCEHLIDACADLAGAILLVAPSVTMLATSREPLDIDGETSFPIRPLPVSGEGAGEAANPLIMSFADGTAGFAIAPDGGDIAADGGGAVELFAARAAAAVPGFTVSDANRGEVIRLCQRLDGIPLAIELAAVQLRALPLAELAARLDRRLPLLTGGNTVTDGRHKTLRDAIGWSFDLCTAQERTLWARLSVFQGAFNVAAATEVCASAGLDRDEVFETIVRLVDKSVLTRVQPPRIGGNDEDQPAWYRMLDTIHEYGEEMLAAAGNQSAVRERFITRYLGQARYFSAHLTDPAQLELFRELRREHYNLQAALRYTLEDPDCAQVRQGAELGNALYGYWHIAGLLREGRYWYAKVLARLPEETSLLRGWALVNRCYLGAMQGTAADAVADGEAGVAIGLRLGHDKLIGRGYNYLALALTIADRIGEARAAAAKAEPKLEALGDRTGLVILDDHWAHLAHLDGNPAEALRYAARCISRFNGAKEWWASAWAYAISGMALYQEPSRDAETTRVLNKSVLLKHELGDRVGMAYCLEIHGWLAVRADRHVRAAWLLGAADPLWTLAGGRLGGTAALAQVHESSVTASRTALGPDEFDSLFERAARAPLADMVALAVSGAEAPDDHLPPLPQPGTLTDREWEVAQLAGAGLTADQIARQLFISGPAATGQLASVFRKLGVSTADQLGPWLELATGSQSPAAAVSQEPVPREPRLQVAAQFLLALDRLEQGLEVALAEAERTVPLDELEEHGRPVANRLGEDLQQVAVLIPVHEDAALSQFPDRDADLADPLPQDRVGVVAVGGGEELHAPLGELVHGLANVRGRQGQVLDAGAPVVLQVLVDLGLALALRWFVERELDPVVAARDDLAHQRGVLGGDVVANELGHVREAHDPVVERDPLVHVAEFHVAHDMVKGDEGRLRRGARASPRDVAGQVGAVVARAVDERVRGVAIGLEGGGTDGAAGVGFVAGLYEHGRPGLPGVRDALVDVGHLKRHVEDAIAVPAVVVRDRAVRADRTLDDETDIPRLEHIRLMVAVPGGRPRVRLKPHPEGQLEVQRRLRRVPRGPDDRVPAGDGERVMFAIVGDHARQPVSVGAELADCHLVPPGARRTFAVIRTVHGSASQPAHLVLVVLSILSGVFRVKLARSTSLLRTGGLVAELDALDLALVAALREHPRAGAMELSRSTHVARATVESRLRRLEQSGVVTGYGPDIDVAAAGFTVLAFVTLSIRQGVLSAVQSELAAIPAVLEAYAITGSADVVCKVAATSHADLQQVLLRIDSSPSVARSTSAIVLSTVIPPRDLPLLRSRTPTAVPRSPAFR